MEGGATRSPESLPLSTCFEPLSRLNLDRNIRKIIAQSFDVRHNYRRVKYHLIFLVGGGGYRSTIYMFSLVLFVILKLVGRICQSTCLLGPHKYGSSYVLKLTEFCNRIILYFLLAC